MPSAYMESTSWRVLCAAVVKHAQERLMQSGRGAWEDYEAYFGTQSSCLTRRHRNFLAGFA